MNERSHVHALIGLPSPNMKYSSIPVTRPLKPASCDDMAVTLSPPSSSSAIDILLYSLGS